MIVRDSLVHEVDVARFLFGEEIIEITVLARHADGRGSRGGPRPAGLAVPDGRRRPGHHEVFVNCQVGYEVRCEAVAERGTVTAGRNSTGIYSTVSDEHGGYWGGQVPPDFRVRFARAYDLEVQAWVDACPPGRGRRADRAGTGMPRRPCARPAWSRSRPVSP